MWSESALIYLSDKIWTAWRRPPTRYGQRAPSPLEPLRWARNHEPQSGRLDVHGKRYRALFGTQHPRPRVHALPARRADSPPLLPTTAALIPSSGKYAL